MDLYQYMMLSETDQWNELWEKGAHLTSIMYLDSKYALYALHKFFVEVELHPVTDKILGKVYFKTGSLLNKYTGKIDF